MCQSVIERVQKGQVFAAHRNSVNDMPAVQLQVSLRRVASMPSHAVAVNKAKGSSIGNAAVHSQPQEYQIRPPTLPPVFRPMGSLPATYIAVAQYGPSLSSMAAKQRDNAIIDAWVRAQR
jgi:hypothetical protein